jgi:BirA family transcriptional regulator, biotin operon repressor / biotin---[acetyl-CoA-carboxylase] ligase
MHKYKSIHYIHFDTIDSTNTWTKNNAHTLDPALLTCVTALEQTAGRGRSGRRWISPKGDNIYATLYFCIPLQNKYTHNLGQVLSISCAKALKSAGFNLQIKWPNDLLLSGKKVAGILTETVQFPDQLGIVLGIGVNVNMSEELTHTIDQPATSLSQLSGRTWTLEQILEPILRQFMEDFYTLQTEGFKPFKQIYENLLAYKGETINFHKGNQTIQGICESITEEGKLNLRLPNGELVTLSAGEIGI